MRKFKLVSLTILVVAICIGVYFLFFAVYSSGYRVGTIIKMSKRGVLFKTHEGQLHTGGVTAGAEGELASTIWDFSVARGNDPILEQISEAADNQLRVKLFYDEKFFQWSFFGDTKYFVTNVEMLQPKIQEETPATEPEENTMF